MGKRTCSVDGCSRTDRIVRGLCSMHYQRLMAGVPLDAPLVLRGASAPQRFMEKVRKTSTCWLWMGHVDRKGYGKWTVGPDDYRLVHRWAYEHWVSPIPDDLTIDHLCRVKNCVNPDHLEVVSRGENVRRSFPYRPLATHCKRGHEFTTKNTYIPPSAPTERHCRECKSERARRAVPTKGDPR